MLFDPTSTVQSAPSSRRAGVPASFLVLVLAGTVLLGACQPQEVRDDEGRIDTAAVKASIDSIRTVYEEAYANGDFETLRTVPHAQMIYSPPGRAPVHGRDSIVAYEERARPPGATLDIEPTDLRVLSPNWVYEYGTSTLRFTPEGAEESQSIQTTYLVIFRKTSDGWKAYRESLSSNHPLPDNL